MVATRVADGDGGEIVLAPGWFLAGVFPELPDFDGGDARLHHGCIRRLAL